MTDFEIIIIILFAISLIVIIHYIFLTSSFVYNFYRKFHIKNDLLKFFYYLFLFLGSITILYSGIYNILISYIYYDASVSLSLLLALIGSITILENLYKYSKLKFDNDILETEVRGLKEIYNSTSLQLEELNKLYKSHYDYHKSKLNYATTPNADKIEYEYVKLYSNLLNEIEKKLNI